MRLKAMIGDRPVTVALKRGEVADPGLEFDFADVKVPNRAFKRVVRDLEFDVAELAIMTFLLAKAHGKPLRLLPAVVTSRFQHSLLVFNSEKKKITNPSQLKGCRIACRSFSVTTATWIRGILDRDYGVDLSTVKWVTFEEPHVAEFRDPPNVERAPAGKDPARMLLDGEVDAAILGEAPTDPRLKPVIADPQAAAEAWRKKHGAIQINHMIVLKDSVPRETAERIYRLLFESRARAGNPAMNPYGVEENRRNLEAAIDCAHREGLIARRLSVDELLQ